MPESQLYLQTMGVAAIASTVSVLAMLAWRRSVNANRANAACVVGIGFGLAIGYAWLSLHLSWPPTNGLDRFLTIVVPVTLVIELIAGFQCLPRAAAWLLRIGLSVVTPRILLHNSVYLAGADDWPWWQTSLVIVASGASLVLVWSLLSCLSQRSGGISIPFALCLAIQCAGLAVMMAGYIKGGAAAIPLVATLLAASIAVRLLAQAASGPSGTRVSQSFVVPVVVGVGVVGLFGLLFIGRFFGEISTVTAVTILFAPLLCWSSESSLLRNRKSWFVAAVQIVLVAIPLLVVLAVAKQKFDRDMSPLLGQETKKHKCAPDASVVDGNNQLHLADNHNRSSLVLEPGRSSAGEGSTSLIRQWPTHFAQSDRRCGCW